MKLSASVLLLFIVHVITISQVTQEWVRRYNGTSNQYELANSLRLGLNNDIYVYGSTSSTGTSTDILALKYNTNGSLLWQKKFNGYGNSVDQAQGSFLDASDNSYITGYASDTNGIIKIVTLKYDAGGNLMWSNIYLPSIYTQGSGQAVTVDNNSIVYICGFMRRQNSSNSLIVIKYLLSGSIAGTFVYPGTPASTEMPVSICADNAGYVYVLASTNSISGFNDILILKLNNLLSLQWQNIISGTALGHDIPVQMIMSRDTKLVVAAAMKNSGSGFDYGICRFDTSSALMMEYIYNGPGNDQDIPYAITVDDTNNIFVTGSSRSADTIGSEDYATLKIDPTAFLWWAKRYNGTGSGIDYGTAITLDRSGNVYAGGSTDKGFNRVEYGLLKYTPQGSLVWIQKYSFQERSEDFIYSVAADNNYNIYVTGISFDSLSDYDIATIKYSQPIGIHQISAEIPSGYQLHQNYPNPFNPMTNVKIQMPNSAFVKLA